MKLAYGQPHAREAGLASLVPEDGQVSLAGKADDALSPRSIVHFVR